MLVLAQIALAESPLESPWNVLRADHAEASSFLQSNWNKYTENYHPSYALDEDPRTAWVEGREGEGVGESLTVPVAKLPTASAVRFEIAPGYQKSEVLFAANAVPKDVTLEIIDRGRVVVSRDVALERKLGWQEVSIDLPAGSGLDAVRLTIRSVWPGKTYKDTCISDVRVSVQSTVAYDAASEAAKHRALQAWIASRVDTARYFASQPPENPFAHTAFRVEDAPEDPDLLRAALAPWKAAAEALRSTPWFRGDSARPLEVMPDGAWEIEDLQNVLRPTDLALFETPDEIRRRTDFLWWSNYKVEWTGSPGTPVKRLFFQVRHIEQGRGASEVVHDWLVEYDEGQRPVRAWGTWALMVDGGAYGRVETLVTFEADATGKIAGWTKQVLEEADGSPARASRRRFQSL
jgi:hypothetical protein